MFQRLREIWLPRLLFAITIGLALLLAGFVWLAPWLVSWNLLGSPLAHLYAEDDTVRRTSLGAAAGLAVTAFLCFRPRKPAARPPMSSPGA